jgi:hypothetical protein
MLNAKNTVRVSRSVVGSRHDPYQRDTLTVTQRNDDGTVRTVEYMDCALCGYRLRVNDHVIVDWTEEKDTIAAIKASFVDLVGEAPDDLMQKTYEEADFDDAYRGWA